MAEAIQNIVRIVKTEAEQEADRLAEIRKQSATDADGLIDGLKLLQAMHDRGVLDILVALFDRGDKVVGHLVNILATPGAANALQTAIGGLQALTKLNAATVTKSLDALASGVDHVTQAPPREQPLGVFDLLKLLKDPDINAAIGLGLDFLKGVGQSVRQSNEATDEHA